MQDNPEIILKPEPIDKALEVMGYIFLALLLLFVCWEYTNAPDTIPIHFDMKGKADDFGDRQTLLQMPIIATFLFFIMTVMQRSPQFFNFPVDITPENAKRQYTLAVRVIRVIKCAIPMLFLMIGFFSHRAAGEETLDNWLLPAFFAFLFIPVGYMLILAFRAK